MGLRDQYVASLKSAYATIQINLIMGLVVAEFPFMANPFLNRILRHFVEKYVGKSVNLQEMLVFFKYIDMRTEAQGEEFFKAASANRYAQIHGGPKEKEYAEANLMAKLRELAVVTN